MASRAAVVAAVAAVAAVAVARVGAMLIVVVVVIENEYPALRTLYLLWSFRSGEEAIIVRD